MHPQPHSDAPTAPETRLPLIDTVRGLALLGIFTVNMLFFSGAYGYFGLSAAQNGAERWLEGMVRIFVQGTSYALFSFLFGLGLALQLRRGGAALARVRRRLLILLLLGLAHAVLIWYGDILIAYAVGGLVLTLFAFQRSWVLVAAALLFFALSSAAYLTPYDPGLAGGAPWLNQATFSQTFGTGSYLEVVAYQARMAGRELLDLPRFVPTVLWLFLLGLLAGRHGLLEHSLPRVWRNILLAALPLALFFKGYYAYWYVVGGYHPAANGYSFAIGGPALMFVYLALLTRLLGRPRWAQRLAPFGLVGRLALTHYLGQSLVCTLIFNGYGLGLFGRFSLSLSLLLVVVIFALQVGFSYLWLARFRFGPAEWVWRSLTYGRAQPLRRS